MEISFSGSIPYYLYWELFLMAVQTPVFLLIFDDHLRFGRKASYPAALVLGEASAALWCGMSFQWDISLSF